MSFLAIVNAIESMVAVDDCYHTIPYEFFRDQQLFIEVIAAVENWDKSVRLYWSIVDFFAAADR